jgi:hypothetical protein
VLGFEVCQLNGAFAKVLEDLTCLPIFLKSLAESKERGDANPEFECLFICAFSCVETSESFLIVFGVKIQFGKVAEVLRSNLILSLVQHTLNSLDCVSHLHITAKIYQANTLLLTALSDKPMNRGLNVVVLEQRENV